jgi:hypothetical protein
MQGRSTPANIQKQAVDNTTEDYWETYFGPYGRQWVRKIPRRVASALIQRTAGTLSEAEAQEAYNTAAVYPLHKAPVILKDASNKVQKVLVEGILQYRKAGKEITRLFSAAFDDEGRLLSLDSLPTPAAA